MFSFKTTVKSGLVALAILIAMLSIRIASADTDYASYPITYGESIVSENYYVLVNETGTPGNYDVHFDGVTCFRWISDSLPVVVLHPRIITYTDPIDDFDLINIIACES